MRNLSTDEPRISALGIGATCQVRMLLRDIILGLGTLAVGI